MGYVRNFETVSVQADLLEAQPHSMHSLLAFFSLLAPSGHVALMGYAVTSAVVAAVVVWIWRGRAPLDVRYGTLIIASVLVSPHLYTYDLVVLVGAFFLLASWALRQNERRWLFWGLLYAAFYLPALKGLAERTNIQWTVPVLMALLCHVAWSIARTPDETAVDLH